MPSAPHSSKRIRKGSSSRGAATIAASVEQPPNDHDARRYAGRLRLQRLSGGERCTDHFEATAGQGKASAFAAYPIAIPIEVVRIRRTDPECLIWHFVAVEVGGCGRDTYVRVGSIAVAPRGGTRRSPRCRARRGTRRSPRCRCRARRGTRRCARRRPRARARRRLRRWLRVRAGPGSRDGWQQTDWLGRDVDDLRRRGRRRIRRQIQDFWGPIFTSGQRHRTDTGRKH